MKFTKRMRNPAADGNVTGSSQQEIPPLVDWNVAASWRFDALKFSPWIVVVCSIEELRERAVALLHFGDCDMMLASIFLDFI